MQEVLGGTILGEITWKVNGEVSRVVLVWRRCCSTVGRNLKNRNLQGKASWLGGFCEFHYGWSLDIGCGKSLGILARWFLGLTWEEVGGGKGGRMEGWLWTRHQQAKSILWGCDDGLSLEGASAESSVIFTVPGKHHAVRCSEGLQMLIIHMVLQAFKLHGGKQVMVGWW